MSVGKKIVCHKLTGTVKCYNARLGFGFITRDDNMENVCFHESALKDNPKKAINSVNDGEAVQFDIVVGEENGNEVANVTGPGGAGAQFNRNFWLAFWLEIPSTKKMLKNG